MLQIANFGEENIQVQGLREELIGVECARIQAAARNANTWYWSKRVGARLAGTRTTVMRGCRLNVSSTLVLSSVTEWPAASAARTTS